MLYCSDFFSSLHLCQAGKDKCTFTRNMDKQRCCCIVFPLLVTTAMNVFHISGQRCPVYVQVATQIAFFYPHTSCKQSATKHGLSCLANSFKLFLFLFFFDRKRPSSPKLLFLQHCFLLSFIHTSENSQHCKKSIASPLFNKRNPFQQCVHGADMPTNAPKARHDYACRK